MSKFIRNCGIAAIIMIAVGFVMASVAKSIHGGPASLREMSETLQGNEFGAWIGRWGETVADELDRVNYDIDEKLLFDGTHSVVSGDLERRALATGADIRELKIDVGGCELYVEASPDDNYYVEAENISKFQSYVDGDTLYVKSVSGTNVWSEIKARQIYLYIPEGVSLKEADINLGAGYMEMGTLSAEEMDISVGAGQIVGNGNVPGKLSLEVGAGSAELYEAQVGKLDVKVSAGNVTFQGDILEKGEISCSLGNVDITLDGAEENYDYEIKGAMGGLCIGGVDYSGLTSDREVDNRTGRKIEVECSMGNIDLQFGR